MAPDPNRNSGGLLPDHPVNRSSPIDHIEVPGTAIAGGDAEQAVRAEADPAAMVVLFGLIGGEKDLSGGRIGLREICLIGGAADDAAIVSKAAKERTALENKPARQREMERAKPVGGGSIRPGCRGSNHEKHEISRKKKVGVGQ